jgi:hypothetical protein
MNTDEPTTSYVEAVQWSEPCIHTIYHTYDLPARPKGKEYVQVQITGPDQVKLFDIAECWLLPSAIVADAYYLYFLVDAE